MKIPKCINWRNITLNKDFWRPGLLLWGAILFVGVLAAMLPACEGKLMPIKKMAWFETLWKKSPSTVIKPLETKMPESNLSAMQRFQKELKAYRGKGNIRIAYYGDSIIEGDLITAMLRKELQSTSGGSGIGFVPITSIVAGFRPTIKHSFSKNWESISFMSRDRHDIPLGISGYTFIPRAWYIVEKAIEPTLDTLAVIDSTTVKAPKQGKSKKVYVDSPPWVKYQAVAAIGSPDSFDRIRLFYSNATDSSYVLCSIDDAPARRYILKGGEALQSLDLSTQTPIKSLYLEFSAHDPIHVYGVSFDNESGVYVDNYPIRGYSGMYFERITAPVLSAFQKKLDYDLIILHYGENVSHPSVKDYGFYYRGMSRTIEHIRSAVGDVPILLISAHGRSIKQSGRYVTSPDIPLLVAKQAEIAKDANCGFWNLYDAMGGSDAMADYVAKGMAAKDYTHFTRKGANHIGSMIYQLLKQEP